MTRKEFLESCACTGLSLGILAVIPAALSSCATVENLHLRAEGELVHVSDVHFEQANQVVVYVEGRHREPIVVTRQDADRFIAVSMICTHKQCELRPEGRILTCPCHGSEFTADGRVLSPPAHENLRRYYNQYVNHTIIIHLNKV